MPPVIFALLSRLATAATISVATDKVGGWISDLSAWLTSPGVDKNTEEYRTAQAVKKALEAAKTEAKGGKVKISIPAETQGILSGVLGAVSARVGGRGAGSIRAVKTNPVPVPAEYKQVIGELQAGNSLMVYGLPGQGKSYWLLILAKFWAQHYGRVQYLRFEESDVTLKMKLDQLDIRDSDPIDFVDQRGYRDSNGYAVVITDSVQSLTDFGPHTIRELAAKYPKTVFVYVVQSTKGGQFRGENTWSHEVDAVLKVDNRKVFVDKSRLGGHDGVDIVTPKKKRSALGASDAPVVSLDQIASQQPKLPQTKQQKAIMAKLREAGKVYGQFDKKPGKKPVAKPVFAKKAEINNFETLYVFDLPEIYGQKDHAEIDRLPGVRTVAVKATSARTLRLAVRVTTKDSAAFEAAAIAQKLVSGLAQGKASAPKPAPRKQAEKPAKTPRAATPKRIESKPKTAEKPTAQLEKGTKVRYTHFYADKPVGAEGVIVSSKKDKGGHTHYRILMGKNRSGQKIYGTAVADVIEPILPATRAKRTITKPAGTKITTAATKAKEAKKAAAEAPKTGTKGTLEMILGFNPPKEPASTYGPEREVYNAYVKQYDPILYQQGYRSATWNSFDPDRAARVAVVMYYDTLKGLYADGKKKAEGGSAYNESAYNLEFLGFVARFKAKYTNWLGAKSRTASAMVTGGSGFNTRRNDKALRSESARWQEIDFAIKGFLKRIGKIFRPEAHAIKGGDGAVEKLREKLAVLEKLQEQMKAANAALRKNPKITRAEMYEIAPKELVDDALKNAQRFGSDANKLFPAYRLTNNNAKITEARARLAEEESKAAKGTTEYRFKGGRAEADAADNRFRLFFDGKPSADIITALKKGGFRWSPTIGAWQRHYGNQAIYAAQRIVGEITPITAAKPATRTKRTIAKPATKLVAKAKKAQRPTPPASIWAMPLAEARQAYRQAHGFSSGKNHGTGKTFYAVRRETGKDLRSEQQASIRLMILGRDPNPRTYSEAFALHHRYEVYQAISRKDKVPAAVLQEYPDLVAMAKEVASVQQAATATKPAARAKRTIAKPATKLADKAKKAQRPTPPAPTQAYTGVVMVPMKAIHTDPARFQNREDKYSQASVERIVAGYDPNKFDAITVWTDPINGKIYVLSGHSRYEAFTRLKKGEIPAKYFIGTEAEAIRFARVDANRSATAESIREDVKAYKYERDVAKDSRETLQKRWKERFGKLEAYSYLDPAGKFMTALEKPEGFPYIGNKSMWAGELRKHYPGLTNAHEREMFDYILMDKAGSKLKKEEFMAKVERIASRLDFDGSKRLNLAASGPTGTEARADTAPTQKRLYEIEAELEDLAKRQRVALTDGEKTRIRDERKRLMTEQERLARDLKVILQSQTALFGFGKSPAKGKKFYLSIIKNDNKYLAKQGPFMRALVDPDSYPGILEKATTAIIVRKSFPDLTNKHEEEIFSWLFYNPTGKKEAMNDFFMRVSGKIIGKGKGPFDYTSPLNLSGDAPIEKPNTRQYALFGSHRKKSPKSPTRKAA